VDTDMTDARETKAHFDSLPIFLLAGRSIPAKGC
jgi:hypothetical protein